MGLLHRQHTDPAPAPVSVVRPAATRCPAEAPPEVPAVLLTFDGWLVGQLGDSARRTSDTLGASPVVVLETDGGSLRIDRDEILLVVPPPFESDPAARVTRRRCPVAVDVGVATVRGDCHVVPGTTPWDTWQRSTTGFAAVTDAVFDFPDGTSETADVVLISRFAARSGLLDR